MNEQQIRSVMARLSEAWADGDADGVARCFAADGRYLSSIGPNPGGRAIGREAIKGLVCSMLRTDDTVQSTISDLTIFGSSAVWKWRYDHSDGRMSLGCDLFEFADGLIVSKDAYRKQLN
ncbi:nuclear transport factor 2 family protein [Erythrobacter sp. JK5]|uniref:nuclear transport factor 2 family protein n=1 Tax=Erythrobacter sp. JK5 TaxID=2829500 RepID=UPI001BA9490C|nr:nuclear transport factor 2 family protein [Erythrobacter sp. JK5]QUL37633.1 nuclear transport factor 2 family protein [Erythrobacter sp. JK5]